MARVVVAICAQVQSVPCVPIWLLRCELLFAASLVCCAALLPPPPLGHLGPCRSQMQNHLDGWQLGCQSGALESTCPECTATASHLERFTKQGRFKYRAPVRAVT